MLITMTHLPGQTAQGLHDLGGYDPPQQPGTKNRCDKTGQNGVKQGLLTRFEFILLLYQYVTFAIGFVNVDVESTVALFKLGKTLRQSGKTLGDRVFGKMRGIEIGLGIQTWLAALRRVYVGEAVVQRGCADLAARMEDGCLRQLLAAEADRAAERGKRLANLLEKALTTENNLLKW